MNIFTNTFNNTYAAGRAVVPTPSLASWRFLKVVVKLFVQVFVNMFVKVIVKVFVNMDHVQSKFRALR